MKTLADFKRKCSPGTKLIWKFFAYPPFKEEAREVKAVRSSDIVFLKPDGRETHLSMPKAADCEFTENEVTIFCEESNKTKILMKYSFV